MSLLSRTFLILPTLLACITWSLGVELENIHEWKYFDYEWKSSDQKQNAIDSGDYDFRKIISFDFQFASDRVWVTTPRIYNNPASLSTISDNFGPGGPLLMPYPNWDWHKAGNCSGITSVQRLFLDDCNRLWLVDSGKIENEQICPAKILAFDTTTDELLKSFVIPDNVSHSSKDQKKGRPEIQIVETRGDSCEETWVFIGDPEGDALIIWNGMDIWRLENDDVYAPDATATTYNADGKNVTLDIGVASFALTPPNFLNKPYLLFKPYSSLKDYAVSLDDLHNSKSGSVTYYRSNLTMTSQELARVFTRFGIVFGGLAGQPVVACWNLENPLASAYIDTPVEDMEELRFISGIKIEEGSHAKVLLMSNRLPEFISGSMDFDDINFRILGVDIASLINGTVCESTSSPDIATIEDKFFFEYEIV